MSHLATGFPFFSFEKCLATWGWLSDNRASIVKKVGGNSVAEVGKEAGAQWNKLSAAKKKPYDDAAKKAMAKYKKDVEAFKAAGGVMPVKAKRGSGLSTKKKRDPNMPKRPASSYMLFLNDSRATIVKKLPKGHKATDVMVEAGKQWKALAAAKKKKYEAHLHLKRFESTW